MSSKAMVLTVCAVLVALAVVVSVLVIGPGHTNAAAYRARGRPGAAAMVGGLGDTVRGPLLCKVPTAHGGMRLALPRHLGSGFGCVHFARGIGPVVAPMR